MIQLSRNQYWLLNPTAEVFQTFDDANRLIGWLIGKKSSHLIVQVVKGNKARLFTVPKQDEFPAFRDLLLKTMGEL